MNKYCDIYNPKHPNSRKNGSVMLHVIVAAKMLGRPLTKGEVVHHKDSDKSNNNYNNLMVFKSEADHICYHRYLESDQKDKYTVSCVDNVWSCKKNVKICPACGKLNISPNSNICRVCWSKERKTTGIPRETLENLICEKSITEIGKIYGVSDNAIRKTLKKNGLPYKAKEIKEFIANKK